MLEETADHLREAVGLPELLVASFLTFEDIRLAARGCEDLVPELLATFMTAADAAVSGREAITAAPSLARAIADRDSGSHPRGRRRHEGDRRPGLPGESAQQASC